MNSLISVIVPVYNVALHLQRCITGILQQSYPNVEIVAVDDGSVDGSGDLLEMLAESQPALRVIHQKNAGVTAARLAGVAAAKGEWIGFVDGDDYIEPDMYERLLKNAEDYGADISHCGYRMVFADGRVNWFYNTELLVQQDRNKGLQDLLDGTMVEPGLCNKLFRKRLFSSLLGGDAMDRTVKNNEDLLMNYLLFSQSDKAVFEDFCPYHYVIREGSASRAPLNHHQIWDPIRVRKHIMQLRLPGMDEAALRAYLSVCINVYNGLMLEHTKNWRAEEPKVRKLLVQDRRQLRALGSKQRLLARLIIYVPGSYRYIYRIYAKYFLKNPYT